MSPSPNSPTGSPSSNGVWKIANVPLAKIDVPPNWRAIDQDQVDNVAKSLRDLQLLQPIGVWPRGERYTLVFGRTRMLAAEQLGWTTINARLLEFDSDEERQVTTDIENLCRTQLNAAERALALGRWHDWYMAHHPDSTPTHKEQMQEINQTKKTGRTRASRPESFTKMAAKQTGKSPRTIRQSVMLAKRLGEEGLDILRKFDTPEADLLKLAAVEDDDIRRQAVALRCAGYPVDVAINTFLHPEVFDDEPGPAPEDLVPARKAEEDLDNNEWVHEYCYDVVKRLQNPLYFQADAILYRETREAREAFANSTKRALSQGKVKPTGPFYLAMTRVVNIDHPSAWLPCGACNGSGSHAGAECGKCYGSGFYLNIVRRGRRS